MNFESLNFESLHSKALHNAETIVQLTSGQQSSTLQHACSVFLSNTCHILKSAGKYLAHIFSFKWEEIRDS